MRADTKVRPFKKFSHPCPLPEGEGILEMVFIDHFEEKRTGDLKKIRTGRMSHKFSNLALLNQDVSDDGLRFANPSYGLSANRNELSPHFAHPGGLQGVDFHHPAGLPEL